MPARIEALEADIAERTARMNDAAYFQRDAAAVQADNESLAAAQLELDAAYGRWAELDG